MKPINVKPLLAAMLLAFAASACQPERDESLMTPSDDVTAASPAATTPPEPTPPLQNTDPCTGMTGAQLDECLQRQPTPIAPPVEGTEPLTPIDPPQEGTPPTEPPAG